MQGIIRHDDAQYAHDLVKMICTEVGPGLPGTRQERERAGIIKRELELHLGAENVCMEDFTVAPDAFLGSLPVSALFMLIAALLNISMGRLTGISPWVLALACCAFSLLAVLVVTLEFILYFESIDRFFPKKESVNVIGTLRRPGTKNVKRLLILSGHHDSALEMTWLALLGRAFLPASAIWLIGLVTMLAMTLIQLAGMITGDAGLVGFGTLSWAMLVLLILPSVIFALFFNRGRENGGTVPGAVDNLAACALTVEMCRFLVDNPSYIPADTEIRFITFGSEEAGVRGSRRYVERHRDELVRLDARVLNFEMVGHPEISILTSDIKGMVKNSPEMVKSVVAAAKRAGVPYKVEPASFGVGTDASAFSQVGLKATTLMPFKMPEQLIALYHQKTDGPEGLTIEPLLNVLKLSLEWVCSGGE